MLLSALPRTFGCNPAARSPVAAATQHASAAARTAAPSIGARSSSPLLVAHNAQLHTASISLGCAVNAWNFNSTPAAAAARRPLTSISRRHLANTGDVQAALDDLASRPARLRVKRALEEDARERMSYDAFVALCEQHGVPATEAAEFLRSLHAAGSVLYFPSLSDNVYLQPREMARKLFYILDPEGVYQAAEQSQLEQTLAAQLRQLDKLQEQIAQIERRADRSSMLKMWGIFLYLAGQGALVARLTWWEFSWDIMEPITYLLGFTTVVIGSFFYATTRREHSYENMYSRFWNAKRARLMARAGLSDKQVSDLSDSVEKTLYRLAQLGTERELAIQRARALPVAEPSS